MSQALNRSANLLALAAALLLVSVIGLVSWFQFSSAKEAETWVNHTYEVVRVIDTLGAALRDAETGQRGYLLTGADRYLAPYNEARGHVALLQGELRRLTADNPMQQENLRALAPLAQRKMDELAETIQLSRTSGHDAALAVVRLDLGQTLMEQMRALLTAMTAEEDRLLVLRQQRMASTQSTTRMLTFTSTVLALVLLGLAFQWLAQSRRKLEASEAEQRLLAGQMRTAFDSVSQGIGVFGPDGRLARWNECFSALLSIPRPMLRVGTPYEAIAEQAANQTGGPFLEAEHEVRHSRDGRAPNEPVVYERSRASDGRSFELRRTTMPDGGFVLTITDITERVRTEESARAAQRLQAMGQLTGGIAHDFNNLLTIVLGNLEMVRPKLEEGSPLLSKIERAIWGAKRGASLTQHLLAFARKQPLSPTAIDLSAMLPDLATLLRRTLGEHIHVRVIDAAGLWPVMADPAQLESAVLNLSLNARDAMPGGGHLTIELANKVLDAEYASQHTEVTAGDYVMIGVSDTGTGMQPEVLARVFEPFFTTKEPGKGTGLGLSMVFGFVKQSGGHVKIYSEPDEGTTIRVYLPRAVGTVLSAPQRAGVPVILPRGSATVLIVEDEPAVCEVAAGILRELGYRVLEAGDGQEALRVMGANAAKVDLLLCDVILPGGMKGSEVSRRLSEIQPSLKTLFMSGYTENAIVHGGRLDDGVHLIGKPFSREVLARKVAEILEVAGAATVPDVASNVVEITSRDRSHI